LRELEEDSQKSAYRDSKTESVICGFQRLGASWSESEAIIAAERYCLELGRGGIGSARVVCPLLGRMGHRGLMYSQNMSNSRQYSAWSIKISVKLTVSREW